MTELYKIHFGFSKSKRYPQAVELSRLAHQHKIRGEGEDIWHIVSFTDEQNDLMASLYKTAKNLPRPKIYGADVLSLIIYCRNGHYDYAYASKAYKDRVRSAAERLKVETGKTFQELVDFLEENYWKPWQENMVKVNEKLREEGYLDYIDPASGNLIKAKKRPKEYIAQYQEIRELVSQDKYEEAVQKYYDALGDKSYGELHNELIYLKRLANAPLIGKDLLYFRNGTSRNELINSNLSEYCSCIDVVIEQYLKAGLKLPLDIIIENAPTMEELIEQRKQDWHLGVYLWDGEFKRDNTPVTINSFSVQYDKCPEGRLFDRYPDQIQHCRVIETPEDREYAGLWTTHSPSYYQRKILDKGLHLSGIEAYRHKLWKRRRKEPNFTTGTSLSEIEKSNYGTNGIRYTGRSHKINGKEFYEIDLLRKNLNLAKDLGNPFIELVEEILREAENLLRENHGLPRIGEGWISEMQLYNLVKTIFPEAQHHGTPDWLKPQHLDVFVPSKKLAFEYQGRQHFEPLDFFGGEESFGRTKRLDRRKMQKCKSNGALLIYWRYDEPINREVLIEKLRHGKTNV
ncbi:hypothetical protein KKG48_03920 [Patescibacteria group bacterium]|nr:hypothetical protein [Patescibacteria group bacterium]